MVPYLGDFPEDQTVFVAFNTFDSNDPSASVTITNLADTDIHIHKDDGTTQHSSATDVDVQIDFDTITGNHMVEIRTTNAFFTTGADYFVRMEGTTVDAATVNAWIAHFSIQNRYMRGTDSAATATALATVDTVVDGIQTDLDNGTDGLGALKALIDTLDTVADGIKAVTDNLPNSGALTSIAQATALATVDTVVDGIQADLSNGTDGLGAIKTAVDTVDTVVDGIQTDLSNGTDGLGAIKTAIDALNDVSATDITRVLGIQKNSAFSNFQVVMVDATTKDPKTGLTVSGTRSIDGAAFGAMTGTITEVANGAYQVDFSAADLNGDAIMFRFSATGADDVFTFIRTVA